MTNRGHAAGISLIEVMVVMVLLLIGIFSVIRLFPPGFLINKETEAATLAARLAQQEVDRFSNNSANLMSAVVPILPVPANNAFGYAFRVDTDATPDDLTEGQPNLPGVDPYYYSDVNKIRRIIGEFVRIPIPTPIAAGKGSVYMLSSGPVYNVPWDGQTESIFVHGAPMFRSVQDVNDPYGPHLFRPQQYAIDYDDAQVAFFPQDYDRQFLATYSYYDANNVVQTIVDEVISIPAGFVGWVPFTGNNGRPLVPGTEVISRKFMRITPDPNTGRYVWSQIDPYQYDVLSPNDGTFANVGVLVFNPLGHNFNESAPGGVQPLSARIDYDVLDWRIIREDRPMPGAPPYEVRLTLKDIKKLGELDDDQTQYIGLFRDPSIPAANRVDLLVYNVGTGERIPQIDPNTGQRNWMVDYKQGIVTFTDGFGSQNQGGIFRFFYKAHGDWALQIQKAPDLYRYRNTPNISFAEYYVPLQATDPGRPTRMYFPLMDAGKTVAIRDLWYKDANGTSHHVTNESFRINPLRATFETVGGRVLTYIDLTDKHPDAVGWDTAPSGIAANGVQGISFKSRVLWTNGSTVSQVAVGNVVHTRWRKIDLDTFLTRTGN